MVDLQWVFRTALEEEGMCVAASEALVSGEVRERAVIRFGILKSTSPDAPSIWSSEYVPDTLVPVTVAADSYPGGRQAWVDWMQNRCSITQSESLQHHLGINDVWAKLNSAFNTLPRIIYYEPIMRKFLREFFRTLQKDGVRWLEFRTAPFATFVLKGEEEGCGDPEKLLRVTVEEIKSFMRSEEGKGFWGIRMIWVGMRWWDTDAVVKGESRNSVSVGISLTLKTDMRDCIRLKKLYPDLISGYDLVGHEDAGRTLNSLTPELLWFQSECAAQGVNIPYFFQ
jgi:adenosine deaminase CECR1